MKINLARALIQKGVISNNTRIVATCPISAMGHMPAYSNLSLTIDRIIIEEGTIKFYSSSNTGKKYSVPCEEITVVDGMPPERLAAAYDIKIDGANKPAGKKRGRKPKQLVEN